ncbi:hypothetical protein [Nocardia niigatensis]
MIRRSAWRLFGWRDGHRFAAALAPDYTPELPIVGVIEGGVPVNTGKIAIPAGNSPQPLFGLGFAVAEGM